MPERITQQNIIKMCNEKRQKKKSTLAVSSIMNDTSLSHTSPSH